MAAVIIVPGLEGLDGNFNKISSGGDDLDWSTFDHRKMYTNAYIVKDGKVSMSNHLPVRWKCYTITHIAALRI